MATTMMAVSAGIAAVGSLVGGEQQAQAYKANAKANMELAEFRAKQLKQQAGQTRAQAQHRAVEERRQANLARSRAVAVAAGSGGGAYGDPTVENILAGLQATGDYNVGSSLYEGEEAARSMEDQAKAGLYESKTGKVLSQFQSRAARTSSYMSAAGNLFQGSASFYEKYWPEETDTNSGSLTMNKYGTKFGPRSSQVAYG